MVGWCEVMGRILIDTRDIRDAARDLRGGVGAISEARANVNSVFRGSWLGPNGGGFESRWGQELAVISQVGGDVERIAGDLDAYASRVDSEQRLGSQIRGVAGWTLRTGKSFLSRAWNALKAGWGAFMAFLTRISKLIREAMVLLATGNFLPVLVGGIKWLVINWRTPLNILRGVGLTPRQEAIYNLIMSIPVVNLFAKAIQLAADEVVVVVEEVKWMSYNGWQGREPNAEEMLNAEKLKKDIGGIPGYGPAVRIGADIAFVASDTIQWATANGGNGRPPNDVETRHAAQLAKDVLDLPKIFSEPWKVATNSLDVLFGTHIHSFLKPSHWLDGALKMFTNAPPLVGHAS